MPTELRLAVLERDLAVALCGADTENQAVSVFLAAISSFVPECGVAVLIDGHDSGHAWAQEAGALGSAARSAVLGAETPGFDHRLILPIEDSRGAFGRAAFVCGDGGEFIGLMSGSMRRSSDMLAASFRRIVAARELDAAAKDRDLLVRELRHRTRNSFQMIKDSIVLLVGKIADTPADVLESIEERVGALVIVHEMLSRTESRELVSAESYFIELASSLRRISPEDVGTLIAYYDAESDVAIPVERAATIGLIVHELVMNTAKHAIGGLVRMSVRVDFSDGALYVRYSETQVASAGFERRAVRPPVKACGPGRGRGRGLGLIEALLARARGRRLDDGSDVGRFAASFPID